MKHGKANCLSAMHFSGELLRPRRTASFHLSLRFGDRNVVHVDHHVWIDRLQIFAQTETHLMASCTVGWAEVGGFADGQLQRTVKVPSRLTLFFLHSNVDYCSCGNINVWLNDCHPAATATGIRYRTKYFIHLYYLCSSYINTLRRTSRLYAQLNW